MDIIVSLISLILLTGGSSGANMAVAMAIPSTTAKDYWQKLFPETLMPPAILDLLTPFPAEELKEVSVSYGPEDEEKHSKVFPIEYKSNNEYVKYLHNNEERLKEVSVSYGSKGDEKPRKAFPMGRYMSNKECEKSLHTNKEGLKEVSVSYGSEGEEDPMGRYMLDKELEKNIYTNKEELREVSVSYGPEEKLRNLFPTGYEHKNYKHANEVGLKEVSVSYGSDGEEETRKAFHTGQYMLDKEHEKSLHAQKGELREVSVSYGPEVKLNHLFPTGYERKKCIDGNEEELKEVSVSYGPEDEEKHSKVFPTEYKSNNEYVKYLHNIEERLKEVSVSYGSKGDEKPRKAFPMGRYMSNKECEKSLHTNKEGLKEVTVSYGGEGEEDPMGRYMLDKELKKNIYTTKEELREVSLSYGPEEKLRNLFPTGYEHKNYKHANKVGLNEVSVSYGSDGEEETRKAFPMGQYMLDKEHEKSLHAQKEDLKEVSVSYTSDGEEESRKAFPTGEYILDKEHEKSLNIDKVGLKEVSVSYRSEGEEKPRKDFLTRGYMLEKQGEKSLHTDKGKDHRRHVHAHSNKMLADVFFFPDVLRPGSIITPTIPPTTSLPALLPRHVADSIPFSTDRFADIVAMFTPASLAMAREIRWALDTCQHPRPLPGEKAGCATSLESLAELAASLLGTREVRAFSAAGLLIDGAGTPARRGRYNVTSVRELSATAGSTSSELAAVVVACHDLTYPYAVFYCHTTKPTAAYAVTLVASDGAASPARMEALAVCHLDTSRWNPENAFFVAHNVKPGEVSVCHFLTKLSIVWVARERDA